MKSFFAPGSRRKSAIRLRRRIASGFEQWTGVDFDDLMRARLHEADPRSPGGGARVKSDAAPAGAVRVDQRRDFRRDAGVAQRRDDKAALPLTISVRRQRLHGAAAANRVMPADRFDAIP